MVANKSATPVPQGGLPDASLHFDQDRLFNRPKY